MSLRRVVKKDTGQDMYACQACYDCDIQIRDEMDIPLSSLVQLVLQDDEEVLGARTLWSDDVLEVSRGACKRGLNLYAVILSLRNESLRRSG